MHRWKLVYLYVCWLWGESSFETRSSQSHFGKTNYPTKTLHFLIQCRFQMVWWVLVVYWMFVCVIEIEKYVFFFFFEKLNLFLMDFLCFGYKKTEVILVVFISLTIIWLSISFVELSFNLLETINKWLTNICNHFVVQ